MPACQVATPGLSLEAGPPRLVVDAIARLCIEDEAAARLSREA